MKNLSQRGRLVERLLYILSTYSFTIENQHSGEIVNVDYSLRDGCIGTSTAEELQVERDTNTIQFFQSSFNKEILSPLHEK